MLDYEFLSPARIVFGWGRRREVGSLAATLGRRAFAVVGSRTLLKLGVWDELAVSLRQAGVEPLLLATLSREPEPADVDALTEQLRERNAGPGDCVLGLGGGSALDLAKAAAALATNRHGASVRDFLEGVGRGLAITEAPLPMLAMPTTGGTGTEATKNAVITSYDPPFKKSLRSPLMVPRVVLADPELGVSVPRDTTAWTGMDAVTQLIESYLSRNAKPLPQALAVEGLRRALPLLPALVRDGSHRPGREALAHAALLSGLALANSGLGFAHGVAAALGSVSRVPHGLACAAMLPVALRVNRAVSQSALAQLSRRVLGTTGMNDAGAADAFVARIDELVAELRIPTTLSELGVRREQIPELVIGSHGNSMNGNPRPVPDDELHAILEERL